MTDWNEMSALHLDIIHMQGLSGEKAGCGAPGCGYVTEIGSHGMVVSYPTTKCTCGKDDQTAAEIVRLRDLLGRYSDHVAEIEGFDLTDHESDHLTPQERKEIASYSPVLIRSGQGPAT